MFKATLRQLPLAALLSSLLVSPGFAIQMAGGGGSCDADGACHDGEGGVGWLSESGQVYGAGEEVTQEPNLDRVVITGERLIEDDLGDDADAAADFIERETGERPNQIIEVIFPNGERWPVLVNEAQVLTIATRIVASPSQPATGTNTENAINKLNNAKNKKKLAEAKLAEAQANGCVDMRPYSQAMSLAVQARSLADDATGDVFRAIVYQEGTLEAREALQTSMETMQAAADVLQQLIAGAVYDCNM